MTNTLNIQDSERRPASGSFIYAVTLLGFAASVIFYWPGNVSQVAIEQWYDARAASVTLPYPPLMSFLWRWFDMVIAGPGLMLVLQVGIYWLAIALVVHQLQPSRALTVLIILIFVANPMVIGHAGSILTDVLGANLALLGFAALVRYPASRKPVCVIAASFCIFALAGLVRYQIWLPSLAALAAIFFIDYRSGERALRKTLARMAYAVGAFLLTILLVQGAIRATFESNPNFVGFNLRYSMIFDIAGIVADNPTIALSVFAQQRLNINLLRDRMKAEYGPENGDPLGMSPGGKARPDTTAELLTNVTNQDIAKQWLELIQEAPGSFMKSRLVRLGVFFGLGNVYGCTPLDYVGIARLPTEMWQALDAGSLREPLAVNVLRGRWFPVATFFFRPISYLMVSLGLLGAIYHFRRTIDRNVTIITLSMIISTYLYWLTFVPLPVACSVRYSYFSCLGIMFASVLWGVSFLQNRMLAPPTKTAIGI